MVEDSEGALWVVKFRGAGQGPKALVAELIVGALADLIGLPVPRRAIIELDESFGRGERDPEIRDILKGSEGPNVGLAYLDGAFNMDVVAASDLIDPDFAARLVWLDALAINPDRMARNPNLMVHEDGIWLIDHGAALFDHHDWSRVTPERARRAFAPISQHILLGHAASIGAVDSECTATITPDAIDQLLASIPDSLLAEPALGSTRDDAPEEVRSHYREWLTTRLAGPRAWVAEAERARLAVEPPSRLEARR